MDAATVCSSIHGGLSSLFVCGLTENMDVRVRTPFFYPDGGVVDVFVREKSGVQEVTDYGEALGWLRMQSISGKLSPKQRRLVEDVCITQGVELFRGQLVRRVSDAGALGETIVRVAQAAVRVSDLWFTFRTRAVETVSDEVADWLGERRIPFERGVRQSGRSGSTWTIDFLTRAPERTSMVFLLSTGARAAARRVSEHVVAGCHDLNHLRLSEPHLFFISLFDDTQDVWSEEDFRLVEQLSEVARWSRTDELERMLRAA